MDIKNGYSEQMKTDILIENKETRKYTDDHFSFAVILIIFIILIIYSFSQQFQKQT